MAQPLVGVCGITIEKFQDIKVGDVIEAYQMEQIEVYPSSVSPAPGEENSLKKGE